jgi:predicted lipid-binding transport protein (Tim44 family)
MSDSGALDIILLALLAGFILLRLRSVLGRRTGNERPPPATPAPAPARGDNVTPLPGREPPPRPVSGPAAAGIARIRMADSSFDEAEFIGGAKAAYEMIVTAFAKGDETILRDMVAPDVLSGFQQAIAERAKAGHVQETSVKAIRRAEITEAEMKDSVAEVTVRFTSDLVNVVRDSEGRAIEGSPNVADEVTDVWTFSRDTRSRDPNWLLVSTDAPAA